MNEMDIVKSALAACETGQVSKLPGFLSDDMVFAGPVPQPVGKKEFVGLMTAMVAGIPNWKFNATDFRQNGQPGYGHPFRNYRYANRPNIANKSAQKPAHRFVLAKKSPPNRKAYLACLRTGPLVFTTERRDGRISHVSNWKVL